MHVFFPFQVKINKNVAAEASLFGYSIKSNFIIPCFLAVLVIFLIVHDKCMYIDEICSCAHTNCVVR